MYPPVNKDFWPFVTENLHESPDKLRLKYHNTADKTIDYDAAITQIECRQRFGAKLSDTLSNAPNFFFANSLAGEQSTSDLLANFHAQLLPGGENQVVDLTCGLGIDVIHLALSASSIIGIDRQEHLADALVYNAGELGLFNIKAICGDCVSLLREGALSGDVAFIDPARRAADGKRIFAVSDCEPNVVELLPLISKYFNHLIIKLSPMLDITQSLRELGPTVTDIYAIGTRSECKEVVAKLNFGHESAEPRVHAITITPDGAISDFGFTLAQESSCPPPSCQLPSVGWILYEPYPSVMKAAPLKLLTKNFPSVYKVANNTHIYISPEYVADFPGTAWEIIDIIEWKSKNLKRLKSPYPQADIAVRNFGMSATDLQNKLGIKSGGQIRILGVTDSHNTRHLLVIKSRATSESC